MHRGGQVVQGHFPQGLSRLTATVAQRHAAPHAPVQHANAVPLPVPMTNFCRGNGQPLPPATLQMMESAFGARFHDVRIHVGPEAASLGAVAFTHGSHIHIAPGHYDPNTAQGRQILGRELAHVVQQRSGRVHNPFGSGVAVVRDAQLDAEAERMAQRASMPVQPKMAPVAQRAMAPHVMQRVATANGGQQIQLKSNGRTIGSVDVTPRGQHQVVVTNLSVAHDHRRQGSGRALMNAALQLARARGAASVVLEARPADGSITQHALVGMYERLGFQTVGRSHRGSPIMERGVGIVQQPKRVAPVQRHARRPIVQRTTRSLRHAVLQGAFAKGSAVGGELSVDEYTSGWATYASLYIDNGGADLAVGGKTKSHEKPATDNSHAEDWMIDDVIPALGVVAGATLILTINRSPCTSTSRKGLPTTSSKTTGCTERLLAIAGTYSLHIIVKGLYGTNNLERAASVLALEALQAGGVGVTMDVRNEYPGVAKILSMLP